MAVGDTIRYWNTTDDDRDRNHPADRFAPAGSGHLVRAIDVAAGSDTVFRWLCQLCVAPYSYDLIDNLGRRSPTVLTPGADELYAGKKFAGLRITEFETGRHITAAAPAWAARAFGVSALSYEAIPTGSGTTRIRACLAGNGPGELARAELLALGAGDLVMMRKQLRTLKRYAER